MGQREPREAWRSLGKQPGGARKSQKELGEAARRCLNKQPEGAWGAERRGAW